MTLHVLVVNPNSSRQVTAVIERCFRASSASEYVDFECVTVSNGPAGIVNDDDYRLAASLVPGVLAERGTNHAAVIACFSDPGIVQARKAVSYPVYGIGEAGARAALKHAPRVGVIAVSDFAVPRHMRHWQTLGIAEAIVERAMNVSVEQSGSPEVFQTMLAVGRRLRDDDTAGALLLGCAGMSELREPLEQALGLPVVDPCLAAASCLVSVS